MFNAAEGVRVAVKLLLLYVTVAGTRVLLGSNNWKVLVFTVDAFNARSKVAVTVVVVLIALAPPGGSVESTDGFGPPPVLDMKTTST